MTPTGYAGSFDCQITCCSQAVRAAAISQPQFSSELSGRGDDGGAAGMSTRRRRSHAVRFSPLESREE